MLINKDQPSAENDKTRQTNSGFYNHVYLQDTLGIIVLSVLTCALLLGWLRAEARYRTLAAQLPQVA